MSDLQHSVQKSEGNISGPSRIRKVVIVGRDEALWLAANILRASFFRTGLEIVAVELPSVIWSADVVPTLRSLAAVHDQLGIREAPLMALTQGTYSLGQRFSNFAKTRPAFIHGFGSCGWPINQAPFHHYWVKARASGLKAEFDDFSLNAVAARQGRFFLPDEETDKIAECAYAYHMDAKAYCQALKQLALKGGIGHLPAARLDNVSHNPENGHITAVSLSKGQSVDGDLFIDATGAESLLLGQALETEFESWKRWFPCDRLLTTSGPPLLPLPSFSQVSAFRSGWVGQFPLRDRTAIRQVYSSVEMDEQEALESAAIVTSMRFGAESILTPYAAGRRQVAWSGNCVGIGEAAAVFDPINNVGNQAILVGLAHLMSLIPLDSEMATERKEYNLNVISSFERIRDYQICHYKLNQRYNQPLWDHCREMGLPDSLAYKIELFKARGHLVHYDDETFIDSDWWSMLIGHGLIPRAYDPVVDQLPDSEIVQRFQHMLSTIKGRVTAMQPMEAHFKQ
jgi:tryptophan halogenase